MNYTEMKLDFGGGSGYPPNGFTRVDVVNADVIWDMRQFPYPFMDNSAAIIHCSHTLEHLRKEDAIRCLQEFHRILKPCGILTLAVPDMDIYIEAHLQDRFDHIIGYYDLNYCVGDTHVSADDPWRHKYLWCFESLAFVLAEIGFVDIMRHGHWDSPNQHILPTHLYNPDFAGVSLYVDAYKQETASIEYVCILAAGRGSRMGHLTDHTNKALLPVGNRAMLSHIVELWDPSAIIVIALGYQDTKIREYCRAAHPERRFRFVEVDDPTKGPGYSLLCCKSSLPDAFYLVTGDCLLTTSLRRSRCDWLGVAAVPDSENYCTVDITPTGNVTAIRNKTKWEEVSHAFIGLAFIQSPDIFWHELVNNQPGGEFEIVWAWQYPEKYPALEAKEYGDSWRDTGSEDLYQEAVRHFPNDVSMPKDTPEWTYHVGQRIIKIEDSPERNHNRILRSQRLAPYIPEIVYTGTHTLGYCFEPGDTFTQIDQAEMYEELLNWCQIHLWTSSERSLSKSKTRLACQEFYQSKTYARFQLFLDKRGWQDAPRVINDLACPPVTELLHRFPWALLKQGHLGEFHGDLQPDNVIYTPEKRFVLLDWRESFAGLLEGDVYYDLGKFAHNLVLPCTVLHSEKFNLHSDGAIHRCTWDRESLPGLWQMRQRFPAWVVENGYEWDKVQRVAALVPLNMAPLHPGQVGEMLYLWSQYMLTIAQTETERKWREV